MGAWWVVFILRFPNLKQVMFVLRWERGQLLNGYNIYSHKTTLQCGVAIFRWGYVSRRAFFLPREHYLANLNSPPSPVYLVILSDPPFRMYFSLCQKKNSLICPPATTRKTQQGGLWVPSMGIVSVTVAPGKSPPDSCP
jgi:hypothetical protein